MCSLIQLGRALSIIANNGITVRPTILRDKPAGRGLQLYDSEPINQIRDVLVRTAAAHQLTIPGYTVLGQVGAATMPKNNAVKAGKQIISCASIIEKNRYQRVIVALVEAPRLSGDQEQIIAKHLFTRLATITSLHENG
jgi:cell division protein FtsI/penicillin-binding protein 2